MKKLFTLTIAVLSVLTCMAQTENNKKMRVLVAYYSATGTTKAKAEALASAADATLYEITPAKIYSSADLDWRNKQSRSSIEMKDPKSRPAIGGKAIDASQFDVIFVGYPIWWNLCPRVVNTWIESQNLKGKVVVPFATSGGSTIDGSVQDLRKLYPKIKWEDGKLLNGSSKEAANWITTLLSQYQLSLASNPNFDVFKEIVSSRYSCRKFDGRKVAKEQMTAILEAGRLAPTAKNLQEQRIYVLESAEMLAKIDAATPCRCNAGTCLVVAYDKNNVFTYPGGKRDSGIEDATIVATHIILAAEAAGVQSCWINYFDPDKLAEALGLPENEEILMIMDLGYAAEGAAPSANHFKRKPLEETVTYL